MRATRRPSAGHPVSKAQAHFMGMSQSKAGRAALKRMGMKAAPVNVGKKFDTGAKLKKLPAHHSKIHAATAGKSL